MPEPLNQCSWSGRCRRSSAFCNCGHRRPANSTLPQRFLKPGEIIVCQTPGEVVTVLGPCVAVTLFHVPTGLAAICHAMLARPHRGESPPEGDPQRWKYVADAVPEMIRFFSAAGFKPEEVEVKLFGGAHLLVGSKCGPASDTVGSANIRLARELIAEAGYSICASDVGGAVGRKVVFETRSGVVRVKRVGSQAPARFPSSCRNVFVS
jgi:chemotaxis protein CheD